MKYSVQAKQEWRSVFSEWAESLFCLVGKYFEKGRIVYHDDFPKDLPHLSRSAGVRWKEHKDTIQCQIPVSVSFSKQTMAMDACYVQNFRAQTTIYVKECLSSFTYRKFLLLNKILHMIFIKLQVRAFRKLES